MQRTIVKLILAGAVLALLAACGVPRAPLSPSLELPRPVRDLRAVRKADKVYLAWTLPSRIMDGQSIRHLGVTRICRSLSAEMKECGNPAGVTLPPMLATGKNASPVPASKISVNYVDTLPVNLEPSGQEISYAVEVLNESQRSAGLSNIVRVLAAPTLPAPVDFHAQITADGVALGWQPIADTGGTESLLNHVVRIYRRQKDAKADVVAAEVPLDTTQFIDHGFEWQKTSYYRATVLTLIDRDGKPEAQVEGEDTPTIKVFADDVFSPPTPTGLQAVFSGIGQQPFIDLVWAPATAPDLAGYNVFRHEEGAAPVKMNTDLVKAPAYRDTAVLAGKKYLYSVSAVDQRGNESSHSEEAAEQVP